MPPHDRRSRFAAILLGASTWPHWPGLDSAAFAGSHRLVRDYLRTGLGVADRHVLDLFDHGDPPNDLTRAIADFLATVSASEPEALLVYYAGHGQTVDGGYRLTVAYSRQDQPAGSTLSVADLAEAIRPAGRLARTYLVLDACFSAAAVGAFTTTISGRGVALLASASRDDASVIPVGSASTVFTEALISVLCRGDPNLGRQLNLREVRDLVSDEVQARGDEELANPEIHQPSQANGPIAELPVFPNPGYGFAYDGAHTGDEIAWCSVASQADTADKAFEDAIQGFTNRYPVQIDREIPWRLGDRDVLDSQSVLASSRVFQEAVEKVCRATLAFFDLTGFEPGVMLLLGIRSVVRRGVTICSVTDFDTSFEKLRLPFLIREINITGHARPATGPAPEEILGEKALSGLRQLRNSPQTYTDLPTFEPIRRMSSDPKYTYGAGGPTIPYDRRVLLLCSFGDVYFADNWGNIKQRLTSKIVGQATLTGAIVNGTVAIERSVDIVSPQIVSGSLFEAIRLTDFCLCDLTDWSPNVLFELGVRLASNSLDPVVILDQRDGGPPQDGRAYGGAERMGRIREQCELLTGIIPVIRYTVNSWPDYDQMMQRHLEFRASASALSTRTWAASGTLPPGAVYRLAWRHADAVQEPSGVQVLDLLQDAAQRISIRTEQGSRPFVFPPTHPLARLAELNARENLAAAWLYLHHRLGADALADPALAETFRSISETLSSALADSTDQRDQELHAQVISQLRLLDGPAS
ncbi:caspase family protein [Frankia sp. Cas3]|uniref:caspase family protein n=1 Tax=Frankia sp. Cas3 TaxID=3073926 RepID=UPI002AD464D2|nr:caspase family protein [Frankia sp. Cas3]